MIRVEGPYLYIGGYRAIDLAERFGTPLYIYDLEVIERRYSEILSSIPYKDLEVLYSCKANSNPEILRLLKRFGSGLDAVSPFEVLLGLRIGFERDKILFTGVSVSDDEMRLVRGDLGVMINIDSISQLRRYGKLFPGTEVSIRINPGFGAGHHSYTMTGGPTKFGIPLDQLARVWDIAREYRLRVVGLHSHIGSGITDVEPYIKSLEILLDIAKSLRDVEFIDIGGGFGIPYRRGERAIDLGELGKRVSGMLEEFERKYYHVRLRIEPGRYIVASSGILLARVVDIKEVSDVDGVRIYIGLDTGMNHLIRPALYGAHHEVIPASKANKPQEVVATLVGNICESGDVIAINASLPRLVEGDVIAIMDAGAYGYSMSSNYNLRPRPAEVVVYGDSVRLARKRESFEDLISTAFGL
jgi:diaminopimelate decarboxylase